MTTEAVRNEIVPVNYAEIDEFADRVLAFRNEQEAPDVFTRYRLRLGVYGQRQDDAQMMRVKLPGGIVSSEQLEVLGRIAREFAPLEKGHITTRENIQFHHLKLEQAEQAMRILGDVGLTSREACGNTVRNVITNPSAGVDPTEVFDTTPYLIAYVRYFVRKPFTQDMPRKFKTSFSSTPSDDAVAPFHDLGFVAVRRNGEIGFKMFVGGGSSIMPKEALPLYDFVPVSEYLRVTEAVLRVFNASDELRKNRMMARIKVLIARIGMDAFRERVEEELKQPWAAVPIGAHVERKLGIPGENLAGVTGGVEFLRRVNLGNAVAPGHRVLVVGGGNSALDAARAALRCGAAEVTIVYRRTRAEMPADHREIEDAEREGVRLMFLAAPKSFQPGPGGRVAGLECMKMKLGGPMPAAGQRRSRFQARSSSFTVTLSSLRLDKCRM